MGRSGETLNTRELVIAGTPWIVVYTLTNGDVWIERVRHAAEEWPSNP
jgi:toxin ParE1/3/4